MDLLPTKPENNLGRQNQAAAEKPLLTQIEIHCRFNSMHTAAQPTEIAISESDDLAACSMG
jgi:hypothetical protein